MIVTLLLGGLLGCGGAAPPPPAATADAPAPTPPLAGALYGGELGDDATPLGDRVRLLLWLRTMKLSPEGLEALRSASHRVRAAEAEAVAAREVVGAAELTALRAPYEALARDLASGLPEDSAAADYAAQITAARAAGPDPRKARAAWIRGALDEAAAFSATLDEPQRKGMASSLFLLRKRVGAELTPELYTDLLGNPWQAGDFASLRRSRSGEQGQLDVGALFTLEGGRTDLTENLDGLKLDVLVAIALSHPDLAGAVEVIQGRRDPLDLSATEPAAVPPRATDPGSP